MKKQILTAFALAAALTLAGCSSSKKETEAPAPETQAPAAQSEAAAETQAAVAETEAAAAVIETEAEAAAAAKPEDFSAEGSGTDAQDGAEAPFTPSLDFGSAPQEEARPAFPEETQAEAPGEKLPDDIPAEGFYELLYDLDEMMKLGII